MDLQRRVLIFLSVLLVGIQPMIALPAEMILTSPGDELSDGTSALHQGNEVGPKDETIGKITPLHKAVRSGKLEEVRALLDQGADVNAAIAKRTVRWHRLETPLETAIRNQQIAIAKLLIEHGANVNARTANGETLLHLAVRVNDVELVRLLLGGGAYPTTMSRAGLTPAHLARKLDGKSGTKHKALITVLKDAEAKALQESPPAVPVAPPSAPLE